MKVKNYFFIFIGMALIIAILGGCSIFGKQTLTKKQQDNVVIRIARGYDINSVKFLSFSKNKSTGYYDLLFKVNGKDIVNKVSVNSPSKFDKSSGGIGLDPIEDFTDIRKQANKSNNDRQDTNIDKIKITYLKD